MDKNTQTTAQTILQLGAENVQKRMDENKTFTRAQLVKDHGSKSAAVRYLDSIGKSRVEIMKIMNFEIDKADHMIYQHVRNILVTIVKKSIKK